MFYSKSTGGFYDAAIHGDNIPSDAVEITSEQHVALLEGQSQGKCITADADGYPTLTDPVPPNEDELKAACKAEAKQRLVDTDFSQVADVVTILTNKAEFDAYRAAVRALYLAPVVAPTWPTRPTAVWA
jgi:hypothetical protein